MVVPNKKKGEKDVKEIREEQVRNHEIKGLQSKIREREGKNL